VSPLPGLFLFFEASMVYKYYKLMLPVGVGLCADPGGGEVLRVDTENIYLGCFTPTGEGFLCFMLQSVH
jgi:hypothetical protein